MKIALGALHPSTLDVLLAVLKTQSERSDIDSGFCYAAYEGVIAIMAEQEKQEAQNRFFHRGD